MCEIRDILDTTISLSAMNKKLQCKGTDSISMEVHSTLSATLMRLRKGCVSSKLIVAVNRNFEIFEFDVISIMWKKSDIFTFRICDKQL